MDITITNFKKMFAKLYNKKDNLVGFVQFCGQHDDGVQRSKVYTAEIGKPGTTGEFRFNIHRDKPAIFNHYIFHMDSISPLPLRNNIFDINTTDLKHGVNMIKGFFTSHKYHNYVQNYSKKAKLLTEKFKLVEKLSKINKKLYNSRK